MSLSVLTPQPACRMHLGGSRPALPATFVSPRPRTSLSMLVDVKETLLVTFSADF
jgi:hypothetical protein